MPAAAIPVPLDPLPNDVSKRVQLGVGVFLAIGQSLNFVSQSLYGPS
jgi:hypothetical protein